MAMNMNLLPGVNASADALSAERLRLDVIAQNIANAQTTRDANGRPYQRQVVAFEAWMNPDDPRSNPTPGVRVSGTYTDQAPGPRLFDPSHPHADAEGFVQMPNVRVSREMVDLIAASRSYEANLNVIRTARQMAMQTLRIGQ